MTIPAGTYVLLEIMDTGEGIKPEILSRIFDPFFSTKPHGEGTGLGLSISYGLIQKNKGGIRFNSKENEFCECIVELPSAPGRPDAS